MSTINGGSAGREFVALAPPANKHKVPLKGISHFAEEKISANTIGCTSFEETEESCHLLLLIIVIFKIILTLKKYRCQKFWF